MRRRWAHGLLRCATLLALVGRATAQPESVGRSLTLPETPGPHWFWLSDVALHRTALFDADKGALLGTISSGTAGVGFVISPVFARDHREIYIPETYYSRGVRGERTDVVTVYDGGTLTPVAEIPLPPKRAEYFPGNAANTLSDDGRFLAVFNLTPMTSLSIVDVRARRFVAEVPTPGCSLVYAAGPRRFFMLCANGAALIVRLDETGQATAERTQPFFDAQKDPLTEKAVRRGDEWLFVSFESMVQPVDVSGPSLAFGERWSLVDDADRQQSWRVGGAQQLAVHGKSGRLYALMHQGGPDTHKAAGREVWVYDLASRRRTLRIPVLNPIVSFVAQEGGLARGGISRWLLTKALPNPGVDGILVTQDDHPVLLAAGTIPPTVTVHDATTGAVVNEVSEVGIALSLLFSP
ncbi:MAG: amine dehydrogenase large subunit [Candidatus Binatia bacterium]